MAPKKTIFNNLWLEEEEFKPWLRKDNSDINCGYCVFCKKCFSLSNMGRKALISHSVSIKHCKTASAKKLSYDMKLFSEVATKDTDLDKLLEVNSNVSCSSKNIKSLTNFVEKDGTTIAEIKWALQCVYSHIFMSAGGASIDIIKTMFPDSDIAANMKLQRTKLTYTIVHGLAQFFKTELIDYIKRVSCFTISFDESLNKIAEKEQLDVYIRFWDDNANEVSCRYYNSAFLGHTTSNDLLKALKMSLEPLDLQRILQISMDGPNVNIKMFKDFKEELKSADDLSPMILDIGTCGIHTLHNSFKTSIKSSSWNLVEFLRAIYNVFKHVTVRRAEFIKITGSRKFPLKFCAVRWLNNICVAERADEILSDLIKKCYYFERYEKITYFI